MTSIVIGYDGSLDARRAIEVAGGLFGGHPATVVTAWHFPLAAVDTPMPSMDEPAGIALDEQLEAEHNARNMVEEGVALARATITAVDDVRTRSTTVRTSRNTSFRHSGRSSSTYQTAFAAGMNAPT